MLVEPGRLKYPGAGASMSNKPGVLYIVATPIGNLEDVSPRALRILREVDLVAAEDTRHSRTLLERYGITTRMQALHQHNERLQTPRLIARLRAGTRIALISDAGTPLVSDPGAALVRAAHESGIPVVPVPGPCAAIAALSAAGFSAERFVFEGFVPARAAGRRALFQALHGEERTLVFYEAPHRICDSIAAMAEVFGPERQALLARELTKQFETLRSASLGELSAWLQVQGAPARGEFVVVIQGAPPRHPAGPTLEEERVLKILLEALPLKSAVQLTSRITGASRQRLYQRALALKTSPL